MSDDPTGYDPLHRHHWGWKAFQLAVWAAFIVANIELEWGLSGPAVGIGGGMLAWYSTGILNGIVLLALRALGKEVPQQHRRNVGQLDEWAKASGLKDKLERASSSKRALPPQEPPPP